MTLSDLLNKTCLIGLTYMNANGEVLKLSQLAGKVIKADGDEGISIKLFANTKLQLSASQQGSDNPITPAVFHLPPALTAWFVAPPGHYKNPEQGIDIENPDYFVTWDVVKKKDDAPEGQHEWWEWHPRTTPPSVG